VELTRFGVRRNALSLCVPYVLQELQYGDGACWQLLDGGRGEVDVAEVAEDGSVRYLRPGAARQQLPGSFFAVAVRDLKGQVVALIAADTVTPGQAHTAMSMLLLR
jgi:hypothetical protein